LVLRERKGGLLFFLTPLLEAFDVKGRMDFPLLSGEPWKSGPENILVEEEAGCRFPRSPGSVEKGLSIALIAIQPFLERLVWAARRGGGRERVGGSISFLIQL